MLILESTADGLLWCQRCEANNTSGAWHATAMASYVPTHIVYEACWQERGIFAANDVEHSNDLYEE
jgi:hypothetical protein